MTQFRRLGSLIVLVTCMVLALGGHAADGPPDSLRAMEHARRSINAGKFTWAVQYTDARSGTPATRNFVSRYATRGDMIFEDRGDADGWVYHDEQGRGTHRYPQLFLTMPGELWATQETASGGTVSRDRTPARARRMREIRAAGVSPTSGSIEYETGLSAIWGHADDPVVGWEERQDGAMHIVTASHRSGGKTTWHIDAERGWNPQRVEFVGPGGSVWESISTLEKFGSTWFPTEVRYVTNGTVTETVTVTHAELFGENAPTRFSPTDIGFEPGETVGVDGDRTPKRWSGDGLVTFEEWDAQVARGDRDWGPRLKRMFERGFESEYDTPEDIELRKLHARESRANAAIRRHQDLWERYTRDFIARYKLEQEQSEKAWTIYFSCRGEADKHLQRVRPEAMRLATELEAAREKKDESKIAECDAKLKKLAEPIEEIFEKALKPRLDKLPTRAQRRAAEQTPATAPADQP